MLQQRQIRDIPEPSVHLDLPIPPSLQHLLADRDGALDTGLELTQRAGDRGLRLGRAEVAAQLVHHLNDVTLVVVDVQCISDRRRAPAPSRGADAVNGGSEAQESGLDSLVDALQGLPLGSKGLPVTTGGLAHRRLEGPPHPLELDEAPRMYHSRGVHISHAVCQARPAVCHLGSLLALRSHNAMQRVTEGTQGVMHRPGGGHLADGTAQISQQHFNLQAL
mmetsp:Transcript_51687/g.113326  ORF Transcript_51687/g.113326 Transcript_51687/m.113326 type:complete len:221 (-) Transcript_51687:160-822(-)